MNPQATLPPSPPCVMSSSGLITVPRATAPSSQPPGPLAMAPADHCPGLPHPLCSSPQPDLPVPPYLAAGSAIGGPGLCPPPVEEPRVAQPRSSS